jgi:hypothetical protein
MKARKTLYLTTLIPALLWACQPAPSQQEVAEEAPSAVHNTLSQQEVAEGWELLWDGVSTNGWTGAFREAFPEKGWVIEDGTLVVLSSEGKPENKGGDIFTRALYDHFELQLECMLTPGANSGIKYFVDPAQEAKPGTAIGPEFQILDDDLHPDANNGKDGNRKFGSLYDVIPAPASKKVNPPGTWNHIKLLAMGNQVEHWLNGEKILSYERGSEAFREMVAASKFKNVEGFGEVAQGHILLQDHNDRVAFRNIKIRKIALQ